MKDPNESAISEEAIKAAYKINTRVVCTSDIERIVQNAINASTARLREEIQWRKEHMEQSDKELCQLQDALGCPAESKNCSCDCGWKGHNQNKCPQCGHATFDDGMADSQTLSMERIRDLIAAEGEAGDLREQLQTSRDLCEEIRKSETSLKLHLESEQNANRSAVKVIKELREQIHDLCHDKHASGPVSPQEFCDGCEAFQQKLFGTSPIADLRNQNEELNQQLARMRKLNDDLLSADENQDPR